MERGDQRNFFDRILLRHASTDVLLLGTISPQPDTHVALCALTDLCRTVSGSPINLVALLTRTADPMILTASGSPKIMVMRVLIMVALGKIILIAMFAMIIIFTNSAKMS